jgi:short-subunit dehydrogenase
MVPFKQRYPGAAVITGASAGIGAAFARRLATEGFETVLVARREKTLSALAEELKSLGGQPVHVVTADLGTPGGPAEVKAATDALGLQVSVLVNNAGFGSWGDFCKLPAESEAAMIDLNCRGVMLLSRLYVPAMIERRNGAVFITASTAAFQPCPQFANYAATKAFDLAFASALWHEVRPHKVDVLAVCPGYTKTEFQAVAGIDREFPGSWRSPEQVVTTAFKKIGRGPTAVDGLVNAIMARGVRFLPQRLAIALAANVLKRDH